MTFSVTEESIEEQTPREDFDDPGTGGFVVFEGRIRNKNRDRPVVGLTYEVHEELARNEFDDIREETHENFDVETIRCLQREGDLDVGEVGIWIGVSAGHRKPAFRACEYIIDEVKDRLPIWKHEHYADGTSKWINCP